jgi:SAM-dependent methyltransferase
MDAKKPLEFADESFDLVNGRTIFGFMDKETWPKLLDECWRVLRPGGLLCMTEPEFSVTNSPALQRLNRLINNVAFEQQRSFSVDGQTYGVAYMLKRLVLQAGFVQVEHTASALDASAESFLHYAYCEDIELMFTLLKSYLIASGLVDEAEYDRLCQETQTDMQRTDFVSFTFGLTVCGRKPAVS